MFENLFPGNGNSQQKAELESEKRQIAASKEMNAVNVSSAEYQSQMEDQERKVDLIKWQQEFDTESMKRKLKNEYFNMDEGKWVKKKEFKNGKLVDMPALMTEEGIAAVENAISGFVGENARNLINSSFSEKQISSSLIYTCNDIVHIFAYNYDKYFINPTPSNMTLTLRIIKNEIKPTPYRALNGFTKRQDNTAIKRVETFADHNNENKKGVLGMFA